MMRFQRDPTSGTRILAVNGDAVLEPDSLRWVEHWGEPDSLVVLELGAPVDEPIGLHVVEHLLRPEELLGVTPFERPPDLAPDVSTMSDRALLRFSVAAFADPRHSLFPLSDGESSGGEPPSAQLEPAAADSSGVGGPRGAEPADTSGAEDAAEDSAEPPPADTTLAPTPGGR